MYNVLFYHANTVNHGNLENSLFLSVSAIYLKTYVELNDTHVAQSLNWSRPIQRKVTDEELIEICNSTDVDLLCLSLYIWNETYLKEQLLRVKSKLNPKIRIMVGGPSVDVHIKSNYFAEHNYADFAIYGPGEAAFLELVRHLTTDKKLIAFNVSNLAWYDKEKKKQVVSEYKNVSQFLISPYLQNVEFFSDIVSYEQQNNKLNLILPYELTRGCPYSCTFCDWNSGLSNKVSRRKNTYKDEIDLFQKLKIKNIYFADANFGQYDEDIEIVEYLAEKNLNENAGFKTDGNLSKLKKDNNLKIYHMFAQGKLVAKGWAFTFSVQDVNLEVLKNINRPDVGWEVHKKMITELGETYPEYLSKVQFIVGLPGQTPQTIKESLARITELSNVILCPFINELLPASPAGMDPEYQRKYNYTYSDSQRIDEFGFPFTGKFPYSCVSFTSEEFVEMIVITSFVTGLSNLKHSIDLHNLTLLENTKLILEEFCKSEQYKMITKNLHNNWTKNNKFYYSIDFENNKKNIPACNIGIAGKKWTESTTFKKMLLKIDLKNISKKTLIEKIRNSQQVGQWFT
jgi:tRNA A37 methylthiotransferase MiaB